MMRRHLPLLADRALAEIKEAQGRIGSTFEQRLVSMAAEDAEAPLVTCRKGCANCCLHPVAISILEGLLLYRHLISRGLWTPRLRSACEEAAKQLTGLGFEVWLLAAMPCVLLGVDGSCGAYEARPLACRTAFSMGDPEACHPHRVITGSAIVPRVEPLQQFEAVEHTVLRRLGLRRFQVPLPAALLVAEKVEGGEIEVDDIDKTLFAQYEESR